MAGELSQHQAIQTLFSNNTWGQLPDDYRQLPIDSSDYVIVRQWGAPNIWVSLILFMFVRVSLVGVSSKVGVVSESEFSWCVQISVVFNSVVYMSSVGWWAGHVHVKVGVVLDSVWGGGGTPDIS